MTHSIKNINEISNEEIKDSEQNSENTETESEYDICDDEKGFKDVAGLEFPTSMINIDLDKFTSQMGLPYNKFQDVLKSQGGPFENGKIKYPAPQPPIQAPAPAPMAKPQDSASAISNEDSVNSVQKKKVKKQTYWKPDEDLKLKSLYTTYGNNWAEIQKHFSDKSKDQIHNHIRHLKKSGKLELIGTKEYEDKKRKKKSKCQSSSKASVSGIGEEIQSEDIIQSESNKDKESNI